MKKSVRRLLSWMLVVCMVLSFVPAASAASVTWEETDQKITARNTDRLVQKDSAEERSDSELVRVSIVLEKPSAVEAGFTTMGISTNREASAYRAGLMAAQKRMEKTISKQALNGRPLDVVWNMTLVGNLISAWVPHGSLERIAAIDGVKSVVMEAQYAPAVAQRQEGVSLTTYPSSGMIGSGALWESGYTGAGTRIAIVDTGTDTDHQSFDTGAYQYALARNAAAKGMSTASYKSSLNLMTKDTIAGVLSKLHAREKMPDLTTADLYLNEKMPFGFNYVDANLNIVHDYDQQTEHGSHVAGIAAANRYIPRDGGYVEAKDSVMMLGVAPDAQLITMKVFGDNSPFDSDYMAAIEDAIMLDCDVVNLSLGTTMPGSPYTNAFNDLMELMTGTDTVVVISAGNASDWPAATTLGYLYNDDVSFNTVGAPGSYGNAFTVASVDNDGIINSFFAVGANKIFYGENFGYGNTPFAKLDTTSDMSGTEYDYIYLDGFGDASEFEGIDVSGKIVFVSRGVLNFSEKANNALSRGAVGVVIYNNEAGLHGMNLTGLNYQAPAIAITMADAYAIRAKSQDKGNYLTGKLTVYGRMEVSLNGSAYYKMSDFSSWGVPDNLTLKPEITAPGGEIYSVWGSNPVSGGGSDQYETMSGTSMAAPQVAGMAALLAQVYKENDLDNKTGISARHLAQSLLMSTAQPLYEEDSGGEYYSILNQGAGLARVDLASQADSFIKVTGQDDYKVKAELGDDPARTGVYSFEFTITNITGSDKAYTLSADLFRQDTFEYQPDSGIWLLDSWTTGLDADVTFYADGAALSSARSHDLNGDGKTNAADADFLLEYVAGNESNLKASGDLNGDGKTNTYDAHLLLASLGGETITVPAGKSVSITVRMALTESAKAELDEQTPNGTYVEAFVYARGVADAEGEAGTVHSIPVLAFYGDWSEPSMYDRGTAVELNSTTTSTTPYLYQVNGLYGNALTINYGDGTEYYYGGNPVTNDDPYIPERNAFNSEDASRLTEQSFTLIRGAGDARIQVTNANTDEEYFRRELGELHPAYYDPSAGQWYNTTQYADLDWRGSDGSGEPLPEGTQVNVTLTAVPHYYRQSDGSYSFEGLGDGVSMTTTMTIDNTAPQALKIDLSKVDQDKLTVKAKDNRHVAAVALLNASGSKFLSVNSPNQTQVNSEVTVELDLTDVYGTSFLVAVYDYANNRTTYKVSVDLGSPERKYFTAINNKTMSYIGMERDGTISFLADIDVDQEISAAEYVGGHVFLITESSGLYVANDEDLSVTQRICQLDPGGELLITRFNDMAYNHADGKLYVQYYSERNSKAKPYLATVDMADGSLKEVCELPVDVNTMAIDDNGNFYSAGYGTNELYTYTLTQITAGEPGITYVGEMGYYHSTEQTSMAWDHNADKLYWALPGILVEINHKNAEPMLMGYYEGQLVGLYTRPEQDEDLFKPVNKVDRVELNLNGTRILKGASAKLEATIWPWNASDRTVTWSSSNQAIATVDANGNITAKGIGECVITAASKLDPGKKASCAITVFEQDKTLRGLVWDELGQIWMSEFNTASLPAYTKLSSNDLGNDLASATMSQDGSIYAASSHLSNGSSDLYKLDPVTFAADKIGPSSVAYVDLAPAPGAPGNSLMAVYGPNVLYVDATTGDYYNPFGIFPNSLVAIAYVGTEEYKKFGFDTMADWYFCIDQAGYVYLRGFLEYDGGYYYLEDNPLAPGGSYTKLDFEMETDYFGSAYFDGDMLYYSAYKASRNNVTLMAIDVAGGSKACYELGTFADGIWPVAGLMEPGEVKNNISVIQGGKELVTMSRPIPVEEDLQVKDIRQKQTEGNLNSMVVPMSSSEVRKDLVYVDLTMPEAGANGRLSVTFDTNALELIGVSGKTAAFAWKKVAGNKVEIAFAEGITMAKDAAIARLTFRARGMGDTDLTVRYTEFGSAGTGLTEEIPVQRPLENPFVDVPEGQFFHDPVLWAVKEGITDGMTDYTFVPNGDCTRGQVVTFLWRAMGEPEPTLSSSPFKDVKNTKDYFYKAVLWAYENGITDGVTEDTFVPGGKCTRAQVVTFLWRTKDKPEPNRSNSPFQDVVSTKDYFYKPVLWAYENGITDGVDDYRFGVDMTCTRAHVVTFLYRTMT